MPLKFWSEQETDESGYVAVKIQKVTLGLWFVNVIIAETICLTVFQGPAYCASHFPVALGGFNWIRPTGTNIYHTRCIRPLGPCASIRRNMETKFASHFASASAAQPTVAFCLPPTVCHFEDNAAFI